VQILEQQRWAEPLRAGIAQVIALDLAQLIGGSRVTAAQQVAIPDDCVASCRSMCSASSRARAMR
jgi:uncharacterized lipoprotein YmbA